jgi:hypothetical protein
MTHVIVPVDQDGRIVQDGAYRGLACDTAWSTDGVGTVHPRMVTCRTCRIYINEQGTSVRAFEQQCMTKRRNPNTINTMRDLR